MSTSKYCTTEGKTNWKNNFPRCSLIYPIFDQFYIKNNNGSLYPLSRDAPTQNTSILLPFLFFFFSPNQNQNSECQGKGKENN